MVPHLPPELVDHIIDYLHDNPKALSACSLTCRGWLPVVRYHRFQSISLSRPNYPAFLEIISGSSDIALFVTSLGIVGSHPWSQTWIHEQLPFLPQLHALRKLTLTAVYVRDTIQTALVTNLQNVTELSLVQCSFSSLNDFVALVNSFPRLERLLLRSVGWRETDNGDCALEHLVLKKLVILPDLIYAESLVRCLLYGPKQLLQVSSLHFHVRWAESVLALGVLLREFSLNLLHLTLNVDCYVKLSDLFGRSEFTLAHCTGLRTCRLRFDFREMCVPENQSLPWIATLLSQLASTFLEEVVIAIRVDYMEDLRALDSECMIRALSCVRFGDLCALNWGDISKPLLRLSSLRRFAVEGHGDTEKLEKHIAMQSPDLGSIVTFVRKDRSRFLDDISGNYI